MFIKNIIADLERYLDELIKTSDKTLNRDYIESSIEEFEQRQWTHSEITRTIKNTLNKFIDDSTHESWVYVVELTLQPLIETIRSQYVDPDDYDSDSPNAIDYTRNLLREDLLNDLEELWVTLSEDPRVFMSEEQWRIIDAIDSLRGINDLSERESEITNY